eukprot:XP_786958.1 PREDICTED: uncharacterized protein LOC581887 [Strongylocentrotus purpuratus]
MDATSDAELARLMQLEFDSETASEIADVQPVSSTDRRSSGIKPIGIVDQRWELIDPIPDVRALFLQFNDQFFWGRLAGVEVRWSPRMTLCAGVCCYEGYGGLCSVRLSQPLLKLRPRKDLVETLLHEMIHAYLFVTQNNKDHDGHGPEFCKHMDRINTATGTHISIYHTFHDEVDSYRQHWWRCDGPCQKRKPYFGYVKRAMNRVPSPRDPWWGEHQRSCGGTYTKIKEPEGYGKKKGGKKGQEGEVSKEPTNTKDEPGKQGTDIRNFIAFSGKGQSLGRPATSTPSSSSSSSSSKAIPLPRLPTSISSSGSASSSATSDKLGGQNKERKISSDGKDISSFFTKKGSDESANKTNTSTNNSGPPHRTNTSTSVGGFQKKPRFTPVVATASGRVVNDTDNSDTSGGKTRESGRTTKGKQSDSTVPSRTGRFIPVVSAVGRKQGDHAVKNPGESLSKRKESDSTVPSRTGRFIPVVSAVGRKEGVHAAKIPGESSSFSKSLIGTDTIEHSREQNKPSSSSGKKTQSSTWRVDGERTPVSNDQVVRTREGIGRGSSEGNKKKRARLADLQAIFDSDSDDDEATNRSSKCPRYSHEDSIEDDNDAILVDDELTKRTSAGSNKENSPALHRNSASERGDIYIHGDSDDEEDVVAKPTSNGFTTGIWKDLSHLSSGSSGNQITGNRRFGRVTPPLWGKSKGKTIRGSKVGQTPPQSSFCEHPWQTAARESDKKASAAVSRVTGVGGVINLTAEDEDVRPVEQVGPKTVPCPVCNLQIEENKINSHLDTCLTFNCDTLFSP